MIEAVVLYTGVAVWVCIAFALIWLVGECVWAVIVAASMTRFLWMAQKDRSITAKKICKTPGVFISAICSAMWFRKGSVTLNCDSGYWRGVFDWGIYK